MQPWQDKPLFVRKATEGKKVDLLDIAGMESVKKIRYDELEQASNKIEALMKECKELFR